MDARTDDGQKVITKAHPEHSSGELTKGDNAKSKKGRVVILLRQSHLILFYISTKYHQNIPKGIRVTELTRNQFQKQNKGR